MTPHHEILRPNIPPPRRNQVTPRISGHNSTGVLTPCPLLWGCVGCRQSADAGCARRAQDRGGGSRRIRAWQSPYTCSKHEGALAGVLGRAKIGMNIVETTGSGARAATLNARGVRPRMRIADALARSSRDEEMRGLPPNLAPPLCVKIYLHLPAFPTCNSYLRPQLESAVSQKGVQISTPPMSPTPLTGIDTFAISSSDGRVTMRKTSA